MRVPVLSNAQILILAATLTLSGLIQLIFLCDSLEIANEIPAPNAVGNAAGTVTVIISNAEIISSLVLV